MSSFILLNVGTDAAVGGGGGTVAFDAVSTFTNGGSSLAGTTGSWTHTPVGTPTAAILLIDTFNADPTSVTYGASSMTKLISAANTDTSSIWGLANPPSGAQTVTLTYASSGRSPAAYLVTVTGSDTATCFRGVGASSTGTSTTPAVTCTDALTGDLLLAIASQDSGATLTPSLGTNLGGISNPGVFADGVRLAGTASAAFSWTSSLGNAWIAIAAAVKHA